MTEISILGENYHIDLVDLEDDSYAKNNHYLGYHDAVEKRIVVIDLHSVPEYADESEKANDTRMQETLRHEIIHAFLFESGLSDNSNSSPAWGTNEEMIDFFALQWLKIQTAIYNSSILISKLRGDESDE